MNKIVEANTSEEITEFLSFGYHQAQETTYGSIDNSEVERALLNPQKNQILKRGGSYQLFVYKDQGKILGRIAVFFDPEIHPIAFISLFNSVNDSSVSRSLFDAALNRIKKTSCTKVVGPIDGSIFHNYRIMTQGFEQSPFLGEPRNPDYYESLFLDYGFELGTVWETFELNEGLSANPFKAQRKNYESFLNLGYSTQQLNNYTDQEMLKFTYDLISKSYEVFPYFTSIQKNDFIELMKKMPSLIDKQSSLFLLDSMQQHIGVIVNMRDLFFTVRKFQHASIFQKAAYFFNSREGRTLYMLHGASLPRYIKRAYVEGKQRFGQPVSLTAAALYQSFAHAIESQKYDKAAVTLIREGAEIRTYFKNISHSTRKYCLFEMNL